MPVRASSSVRTVGGAFSLSTIRLTWLVSAIGRTRLRIRASSVGKSTSAGSIRRRLLGLRDVEQVVDQPEQRAARIPDQLDLIELLGLQSGLGVGLG